MYVRVSPKILFLALVAGQWILMCWFKTLSNATANTLELYVSVMEGRSCFNLTCLTSSSVYMAETGGVSFLAEADSTYYIAVSVPSWIGEAGSFTLIAEVGPPRSANSG